MSNSRSFATFGVLTHGIFAGFLLLCGCEKSEQITTYSVPKHESLQTAKFLEDHERRHPKPERMIGVVIPQNDVMWFFKLQGPVEQVAARENDVREFLKSVRFSEPFKMDWTLPVNWRQLPATEMRYATLVMDGEPPLEISVTQLPVRPGMAITEQVVANINRWRNQLSLPPIEDDDLKAKTEQLSVADTIGFWINIEGHPKPKPAGMAQPQRPVEQKRPVEQNEKREKSEGPVYDTPQGWVVGTKQYAVVAFQITDDQAKVLVTVTPAAGDQLANVNRWRGQLQLEPLANDELQASAKKVAVGSLSGEQFDMTNEGRTIFGVIVEDRGQTWFIKLMGDADLAERERPNFEAFLKSLKWK